MAEKKEEAPEVRNPFDLMLEKQKQIEEQMSAVMEQLNKDGFEGFGYSKNKNVEIPGRLFAMISNYMSQVGENIAIVQRSLLPVNEICEAILTGTAEFQLEFIRRHAQYCKDGITISPEEVLKENAEDEVKPVDSTGTVVEEPVLKEKK